LIYVVIAFTVVFLCLEGPGLRKRLCWREILAVLILLVVSSAYGISCHFNSSILPNPKQGLYLFSPLADAFRSLTGTEVESL
jgi:hypothetical protein